MSSYQKAKNYFAELIHNTKIKKDTITKSSGNYYLKFIDAAYWGKSAAGILFICSEDETMLLTLRSPYVNEPRTWGIPGGAVRFDEDKKENTLNGAKREVREELGSLPKRMKEVTQTVFSDKNFTYTTFVFDIPLEEKNKWTPSIVLNWENDKAEWFNKSQLPSNLHFGIRSLASLLERKGERLFDLPSEEAEEENEDY